MKLRNKKTGEICDFKIIADYDDCTSGWRLEKHNGAVLFYDHIDEIHEEWEDYEEPKEYWYLENNGEVVGTTYEGNLYEEKMQEVGNYFDTREEAEKAVEKLKAWKRLKDKGFEINDCVVIDDKEIRLYGYYSIAGIEEDLDLLFGGEE